MGLYLDQLPVFVTTYKTVYCWIPIWTKTSKTVSSSWLFVDWCACLDLWATALKGILLRLVEAKLCICLTLVFWLNQNLGDGIVSTFMLPSWPSYNQPHTLAKISYQSTVSLKREVGMRMWIQIWPYHRKVVLRTVEVWHCISVSGGRSIPTEEFMSPSKQLMNSWPKSKFSWLKQLLVSSIQKSLWKEGIK